MSGATPAAVKSAPAPARGSDAAALQTRFLEGLELQRAGKLPQAFEIYKEIRARAPRHFDAAHMLGVVLQQAGQNAPAAAALAEAIALNPRNAAAHYNRGLALQGLRQFGPAIDEYCIAIALDPDYPSAYTNLGNIYRETNRCAEALAAYATSLRLRPDHPGTLVNAGLCYLKVGDYPTGLAHYEARWRDAPSRQQAGANDHPGPRWQAGMAVAGKTVLLHSEQGLGDTLQFCRYAVLAARAGARVLLEVPKRLVSLLGCLEGVSAVIEKGQTLPAHDLQCPLLSLPAVFGTTVNTVPALTGYLRAAPDRVTAWRARLGPARGPRIGLVWNGGPDHKDDRSRSMRLADLLPWLPAGGDYVSLQKEVREVDRPVLAGRPDIRHYGDEQHDFSDAAALCALMDVVVSVDTSVAHLAAALARPTWIPLAFSPDWRWLLGRADSPWYPTARLYRQVRMDDWSTPLSRLRDDLAAFLQAPR